MMIVTAKCSAGIVCLAAYELNIKGYLSIPEYSCHVFDNNGQVGKCLIGHRQTKHGLKLTDYLCTQCQ